MKLVMTVGIPGSGKSYWAKQEVFEKKAVRTNKDDIRAANKGMKENKIVEHENGLILDAMQRKAPYIIVDNTHLNKIHWKRLEKMATDNGYEFEMKWFDESLDPELCHKRNLGENRTAVPWTVIEDMYQSYFKLMLEREGITEPTKSGHPIVLVDIDGTIAHNDDVRGFFEWDKVDLDTPHQDVINLLLMMMSHGVIPVFMSGRDEVCRQKTADWITKYVGVENPFLFMRSQGDMRKDSIVKYELYMKHIHNHPYWSVSYVLDDRFQVVRMWRALGLRCLSVANGLF